jgi:cytochrome c oxidase subunit 2
MKRRLFTALLLSSAAGGGARLAAELTPKEIGILAQKFEFMPDEIKLKRGETVTLVVTALDRIHGFKIPQLGIRADVIPGQDARITITPDKVGEIGFLCDVFCGDGHEDMNGTLIVEA